jgi:hypothetical protein
VSEGSPRHPRVQMNTRLLLGIIAVVIVGVLLGLLWAFRSPQPSPADVADTEPPAATEMRPAFGTYFSQFFLGRSGTERRIRRTTPLIRTTKFLAGERVGIRVQTAAGMTTPTSLELRFLSGTTREETSELRRYRQRFTIQPAETIESYCCVDMPKDAGSYTVGIVVKDAFIGFIPVRVKAAPKRQQSGFFAPAQ